MSRALMDLGYRKKVQQFVGILFTLHISFSIVAEEAPAPNEAGGVSDLSIYNHKLSMDMPEGWHLAFKQQDASMFSAEFVPAKQSILGWQSLLCVQSFKGLGDKVEPKLFLDTLSNLYRQSCLGDVIYHSVNPESAGESEVAAIMGCTNMPSSHHVFQRGKNAPPLPPGEIGFYRVFRKEDALYLIHKSSRGEKLSSQSSPVTPENYQDFMKGFSVPIIKIP